MSNLVITITDAGRAEIVNAANTGTEKVLISQIGIGSGTNPSTPTQTALQNEIKRLTTFGGTIVASDVIHVSVKDTGSDAYEVHEVGLYTDKGTLFAVYSQAAPILEKTASSIMLLAVDVTLQTLDTDNITFGDIEFVNPPASEKTVGVSRFATDTEAAKGEADDLMLSPKRAKPLFDARQPISTTLTSLAGLVSGANKLPYFTGGKNDEMALADLTEFMRGMLAKNDLTSVLQY
ncbi:phage tail protein, partial [Salmonella enterica subsp. enterica]|nr:phage tail protein [Salmonella enterica subsp. enterica serovar Poona]